MFAYLYVCMPINKMKIYSLSEQLTYIKRFCFVVIAKSLNCLKNAHLLQKFLAKFCCPCFFVLMLIQLLNLIFLCKKPIC